MSVDLGLARTGIAASDINETFAFPKTVITEYNPERLIEKIAACAKEYGAGKIVVGLPVNMDGTKGDRAKYCEETALKIAEKTGLCVDLADERCTTVQASRYLDMNDTRGKKRKQVIDAVAAVVILEDYLKGQKSR